MIPKIIHYCWFGKGAMPELVERCTASWHTHMPDWEFKAWNEDNFDINTAPRYVQEAYAAKKYAFVSDYVRLWALEREGGVYLDTDVEVLRSFEPLLSDIAFVGLEESLALLPGTCVMGCEAHCQWVKDMLSKSCSSGAIRAVLNFCNINDDINLSLRGSITIEKNSDNGSIIIGDMKIVGLKGANTGINII